MTHCDGFTGETSRARSTALARDLAARADGVRAAMLIAPGIDVDMDEAIAGIESVFCPEVPIFGGTASDNMKGIATYQCVNDHVYEQGAFLVGFSDPTLSLEGQATHGFVATGPEYTVPRATGHRVHEIDGQPAWQVYNAALGLPESAAPGDTIPPRAVGLKLSAELAAEYGDTHLLLAVTRLSLMRRDEARIFANLATMMAQIAARTGGRTPVAVFHTDCGARGRLMLDRVSKDEIVANMQRPLFGDACGPWLGMYGFGEITLLGGRNRFHNYTTSLYVLTRRPN